MDSSQNSNLFYSDLNEQSYLIEDELLSKSLINLADNNSIFQRADQKTIDNRKKITPRYKKK